MEEEVTGHADGGWCDRANGGVEDAGYDNASDWVGGHADAGWCDRANGGGEYADKEMADDVIGHQCFDPAASSLMKGMKTKRTEAEDSEKGDDSKRHKGPGGGGGGGESAGKEKQKKANLMEGDLVDIFKHTAMFSDALSTELGKGKQMLAKLTARKIGSDIQAFIRKVAKRMEELYSEIMALMETNRYKELQKSINIENVVIRAAKSAPRHQ